MAEEKDEPVGADERRVGLWGATQSGKTTFISSLFLATGRLGSSDVRIRGNNTPSTDFLIRNTEMLNRKGRFPEPTIARLPLSWTIQMMVPNRAPRRFLRPAPEKVPFDFRVDMQDVGGFEHHAIPEAEGGRLDIGGDGDAPPGAGIAAYFASCQGLLLLIDPIRHLAPPRRGAAGARGRAPPALRRGVRDQVRRPGGI
jgi:hypothetical protein